MGLLSDWLRRKRSERQSAEPGPDPAQLEALRLRARHRLVGASVLVLIAVLLLPRVFEGTPRPLPPSGRATVAAAVASAASTPPSPQATPPVAAVRVAGPASAAASAVALGAGASGAAAGVVLQRPVASAPVATAAAASSSNAARRSDPARAQALLEGRPQQQAQRASAPAARSTAGSAVVAPGAATTASSSGRYFVQVGAFGNDHAAHEMRGRMERLGMKASEQEVSTASGRRIRVRLGPYGSRDEASAVLAKVRASGVDAALMLQ